MVVDEPDAEAPVTEGAVVVIAVQELPANAFVAATVTPAPDRVRLVTVVVEPGLLKETTRVGYPPLAGHVPLVIAVLVPAYSVADVSVTVFTFEPNRPNV